MCGIAGWLNGESINAERVLARLGHRGPDGRGSLEAGGRRAAEGNTLTRLASRGTLSQGEREGDTAAGGLVHLLHARLSIIDLSDAGAQPMRDPSTGNVITCNGEIYNFRSLRDELTEVGEPWLSHSDTEVTHQR